MTKTCFVVGAIGDEESEHRDHADWLLDGIIEPVFTENFPDFEVVRSDKIAQPGMIDSQVINHLLDAELVIADMTFLNANAFYEIGLRHMERKPIIHMFRVGENIPFDVKPYRAIQFSVERPSRLKSAKEQLKHAVEAILAPGYEVENPVTRARGYAQLSQHAMSGIDVVMAELDSFKSRLQSVELSAAVAQDTALRAIGSPPFANGGNGFTTHGNTNSLSRLVSGTSGVGFLNGGFGGTDATVVGSSGALSNMFHPEPRFQARRRRRPPSPDKPEPSK